MIKLGISNQLEKNNLPDVTFCVEQLLSLRNKK